MRRIYGESVVVDVRQRVGFDNRGNEIWEYTPIQCDDVLVGTSYAGTWTDDRIQEGRPEGVKDHFSLYFPKDWSYPLRGARVHLRGITVKVVGEPERYTTENLPTACRWNIVARVTRIEG